MSTNERMDEQQINEAPSTTIWITSPAGYRYRSMEDRQAVVGLRESELLMFNRSSQHHIGPSDSAVLLRAILEFSILEEIRYCAVLKP
jgi:hypothetical protein